MSEKIIGPLSIDLGNTNTVLAFQGEKSSTPILVEMPSITKSPGIVPTAIWFEGKKGGEVFIGTEALKMINENNQEKYFYSNFKRLIGNPYEKYSEKYLSPEQAGEKFFKRLWDYIPEIFVIKRLVLTAPIDTYKGYRKWLVNICD